ncbi:hypothetical protein NQ315_001958 [Exocentrus adspersus]|uniref:Carboxylic ester hydrolase n=1 Tax=Exocentrus adspersus TaxID=1586481 RepID=A0AAV8WB24_9CUCU|nr:hypothetical protein NQ315_001958 [Exocentrus adspersus]
MLFWLFSIFLTVLLSFFYLQTDDPILVTLPEGKIRGHTLRTPNNKTFYAFQEIPFAAPPVGELRFKPPAPPKKWDGVLNATANTKMCYQGAAFVAFPDLEESEDCLYLNVYTPAKPGNSSTTPLPVLVWIYGGSYVTGAGVIQLYKPGYFVDQNIIVVTLNYRLGPLGFLTTEDGVIPGNLGLKDQNFAFQWIQKNINLFGGDPEKVTIAGESAGGSAVGLHVVSKKNAGLFRGAIMQSGTATCQWTRQVYARDYAFKLGRTLDRNFKSVDSKELLKLLMKSTAADITKNTVAVDSGKENLLIPGGGLIWAPVIEDVSIEGAFLTGPFHEDIKTGNINHVSILLGFNSEEVLYFMRDDTLPTQLAYHYDSDYSNLIKNKYNMTAANKSVAGRKLKQVYTNGKFSSDVGLSIKFSTDEYYSTPITRHAKLQSNYSDVYLYQFSYKGELGDLYNVEVAGVRGVGHTEELRYMWDAVISDQKPPHSPNPDDLVTRQRLLTLWANFVKHLNPTPSKDSSLNNVIWDKLTPDNLVYLNINRTLEVLTNPRKYLAWEKIVDEYAIPPLATY